MMEVMEIDEAHAIDHKILRAVLIMRCDTGFTMLNLRIRTLIAEAGRKLRAATRDDRG